MLADEAHNVLGNVGESHLKPLPVNEGNVRGVTKAAAVFLQPMAKGLEGKIGVHAGAGLSGRNAGHSTLQFCKTVSDSITNRKIPGESDYPEQKTGQK